MVHIVVDMIQYLRKDIKREQFIYVLKRERENKSLSATPTMSWLPGRTPSSAEATTPPGDYDEDNVENVERLRHQLSDIQRKLQKALGIREGPPNKDAGHVDVDFVQTKPSKRGALVCKKKNVKIILHGFHVVSALVPAGEK